MTFTDILTALLATLKSLFHKYTNTGYEAIPDEENTPATPTASARPIPPWYPSPLATREMMREREREELSKLPCISMPLCIVDGKR
jgi:hypothetical protein